MMRNRSLLVPALLSSVLAFAGEPFDTAQGEPPPAEEKMKVFLFAGQSNMVGHGNTRELPEDQSGEIENVFQFSGQKWQPYAPKGNFGPEHSFVREISAAWPGRKIGFIKVAAGGTSLLDWDPDWTQEKADITGGKKVSYYEKLTTMIKQAREQKDFEIVGMIWMQGGRDTMFEKAAKAYEENFKNFIARIRADTGVAALPFIFGRTSYPGPDGGLGGHPHLALVQAAQEAVADEDKNTVMIRTKGLPTKGDNIHFNTEGQLELGRRLAKAYLKMLEAPEKIEAQPERPTNQE
jgi:hypothetical protein